MGLQDRFQHRSRARALRSHQVLKEESSSWIKLGSSRDEEEDFQEDLSPNL